MADGNGTTGKQAIGWLVGTGILGVLAAGMLAVANDARIAINVAEQHGQELLILRGELVALRAEMAERTQNRWTSRDQEQFDRYIEERLERLEQELDVCCRK